MLSNVFYEINGYTHYYLKLDENGIPDIYSMKNFARYPRGQVIKRNVDKHGYYWTLSNDSRQLCKVYASKIYSSIGHYHSNIPRIAERCKVTVSPDHTTDKVLKNPRSINRSTVMDKNAKKITSNSERVLCTYDKPLP